MLKVALLLLCRTLSNSTAPRRTVWQAAGALRGGGAHAPELLARRASAGAGRSGGGRAHPLAHAAWRALTTGVVKCCDICHGLVRHLLTDNKCVLSSPLQSVLAVHNGMQATHLRKHHGLHTCRSRGSPWRTRAVRRPAARCQRWSMLWTRTAMLQSCALCRACSRCAQLA